ncbi:ABC transporter ATP-binding protein [Pontibacillus chungwhensis BH030062]|uniref:ABC transporter ATP-binding protein n=1 Tax=Pontibacillus chungwhensis BH030062 TaxID=1385513 RepID=A0A0A2UNN3_9BACI|nr:ABC transporter ATP-binding protein [Pontibacillus chungwhensis]KGP89842.1 ABC transporter ATP-binding protein [Pontibacillus chungwhensis BH030062]
MSFIHVQHLNKQFDGTAVIEDVSFQLEKGMCVSLLGPNGAGKTTTLRILSGLMKPTSGIITFEGKSNKEDIRSWIGYLPQYPVFHNWMSGREFLIYVARLAYLSKKEAASRADQLLQKVGLHDAKNRRIGKYSGGMKQRLGIAQAMIHRPKLIMLDEPVSSLDPNGRREVLNLIDELKKETTILFSTHILSDAEEVSDRLLLLHNGTLHHSGTIEELQATQAVNRIILRFDSQPERYIEQLDSLPEVIHIEQNREALYIEANKIEAARSAILHQAAQYQWPLTSFEIGRLSLEELFMKVVNK